MIEELERGENMQEAKIVNGITLGKLAKFAKDRFDESVRASGRAEMYSVNFYALKADADYWGRLEEISQAASELEGKN